MFCDPGTEMGLMGLDIQDFGIEWFDFVFPSFDSFISFYPFFCSPSLSFVQVEYIDQFFT